ncbi:MAG: 6-carboxytetrahydropterin synthase QueD [Nitrospirae bacterium]|nr:6-carboxytetrahydropterin synthase QueD [Nitrospirota bacterium]MBF0541447.1 6-carboxytetrahydropterin synthase QueD [Nitrospirota bacterium]
MFELMVETGFAAAHQLRGYKGKCEALHGHNWKVQVFIQVEKLNEIDLGMDFHQIKDYTKEILSTVDHGFLNEIFPFTQINPSSENIAKWVYDSLIKKIDEENVSVAAITVWESETASATYYED